ncbi:MAG: type I methionyl aminopeptidase [Candidatus Nanopelagicales bacterium]
MFNRPKIEIKNPEQIFKMHRAGRVVGKALAAVEAAAQPGVSSGELDDIAKDIIFSNNAAPSFLGYHGFPAHICVSINDEVVHGIPARDRILQQGDLVSVDCGAIVEGWHGDAAITIEIGAVKPELKKLSALTHQALMAGIAAAQVGNRISDIGQAIENVASSQTELDIGIVQEYVGHGIGSQMHMAPSVPNYGPPGNGVKLVEGMAIAIEPMFILGSPKVHILEDEWTVVSSEGAIASHWENTIVITKSGPEITTVRE